MKTVILLLLAAAPAIAQDLLKISIRAKDAKALCYSPDNQYLAFAIGNDIELYSAGSDTRIKDFTGTVNKVNASHTRYISSIAFSMNSQMLASGSADKTIKIWSVPAGDVMLTLQGATAEITQLEFVDNDTKLLSLAGDMTASLWDIGSGKIIYTKKVAEKAVRAMHVSSDSRLFAVGGGDRVVALFDLATGEPKARLEGHRDWVRSLKFSPDGKQLATAADDRMIFLWDVETATKTREFQQRGWIYDIQFSQDGKYLGAALEKSSVVFYNISTGLLTLKIDDFIHPVLKLAISPGGKEASTIEEFETDIKIWNIESLNIAPVFRFRDNKDTSAPLVMISNPPNIVDNKVRIFRDMIDLRGVVTDDSGVRSLKINGKETPVRDNGNFLIHIPLSMGDNYISVEVTDVNDNIALRKFVITRKNPEGEEYNPIAAKNYLLVVGINNYQFWPKLNNAVKDVNDVSSVLMSRYNFDFSNIIILKDEQATRSNIYNSMRGLIEKISPQDNLVVYFSGHGFFDDLLNEGYWIPVDAHVNSTGEYISNTEILKVLGSINSQHTFLVADACFSGALFADAHRGYTENVEKYRSRWGLTSGRLEVVSDGEVGTNSPFAKRLIEFLVNNQKPKFPVSELVQYVKTQVAEDNLQTPIGNPIKALGDEGGEFVFYMKN